MRLTSFTLLFTALLPSFAFAQEVASSPFTVRIFAENDGSYFNPVSSHDRHYTSGQSIALLGEPAFLNAIELPQIDLFSGDVATSKSSGGLRFVWQIFTPDDIEQVAPIARDMPFAGHFYIGAFAQRALTFSNEPNLRVLDYLEIDGGVIGPSARGHQIQRFIHENIAGRPNGGWVNQQSDEAAVSLLLRRKWVLNQDFFGGAHHKDYQWEVIPDASVKVGNVQDYLNLGCEGRFGVNLPHDFGTPRFDDVGVPDNDWSGANRKGSSFYIFARASMSAYAYDIFTQGSLFHDTHSSAGSQIHSEPLRGDLSAGLRYGWDWGRVKMDFGYALTVLTRNFKEQKGWDSYGSFRLGATVRF